MKNLKIFTAVVALAFLSLSFTTTTTKETKKQLHDQIVELIGDSNQILADINLNAEITFTLNDKSEIVVVSVQSDNIVVDNFIKSKLNYKKVNVKAINPGKMYRLPLKIVST